MEEALGKDALVEPMAAAQKSGAFLLSDLHVCHHRVQLAVADDRPHLRGRLAAVADTERADARHEPVEERLVDLFVKIVPVIVILPLHLVGKYIIPCNGITERIKMLLHS